MKENLANAQGQQRSSKRHKVHENLAKDTSNEDLGLQSRRGLSKPTKSHRSG